jgi:tRNA threonylcarbamoyl adenosine modification protein YeaZ
VLVLAIDSATAATAVALVRLEAGGEAATVAQRRHVDPREHGEQLAPMIASVLSDAGARAADLAAVVAGTGPGPYTGLRVGLATAAAMAQALQVPTYGVCSLDGIGAASPVRAGGPSLVATDARRREIYWALYDGGVPLTEPAVHRPAEVAPVLAARGVRQAYGEGALRYRDELGVAVADEPTHPDPAVLASVAADRIAAGAPGEALVARYLRRPHADAPGPAKPVVPPVGPAKPVGQR